jgi:hypothetical protein
MSLTCLFFLNTLFLYIFPFLVSLQAHILWCKHGGQLYFSQTRRFLERKLVMKLHVTNYITVLSIHWETILWEISHRCNQLHETHSVLSLLPLSW